MSLSMLRRHAGDCIVFLALCAAIACLVIYPQQSVSAAKDGLSLCTDIIVPSLFPFFVLSNLTVHLGFASRLGRMAEPIMRPLFGVSGACSTAFILGFIGGYPVGAKNVTELYASGNCTKSEAERMLAFCNNSGPAFIFGVVGAGIFKSARIGLILYIIHVITAICIGLIFRSRKSSGHPSTKLVRPVSVRLKFTEAFTLSVSSAFQSVLGICGFVIFFTVIIQMLQFCGVIPAIASAIGTLLSSCGIHSTYIESFLVGMIELSSGVRSLSSLTGDIAVPLALASFMLGWAGISVHCQVLSITAGTGLSTVKYLIGKVLHGTLAAAVTSVVFHILPASIAVMAYGPAAQTARKWTVILTLMIILLSFFCLFVIKLQKIRLHRPVYKLKKHR
jgi:sporulation integral membrane protein YlbJ